EVLPGADTAGLVAAGTALAVLVGVMLVVAAVLRLGFIANFISEPVLVGFKAAMAVVITVDQIPKLLGFHITKTGFLRDLVRIAQHVPQTSLITLGIAVALFVLIVGLERFVPRAPRPAAACSAPCRPAAGHPRPP